MKTTINRLAAILLAIITVLGVVPMSAMAAAPTFTDVPQGAWFYEPVMYMAGNNPTGTAYMSGTGNNKFSPNQTTTRAMFVTVLGRIAGIDKTQYEGTCTFRDVKKDWAEPYIAWASQNNIVSGIGDNKFGPNNYVTREQSAVILYNYLLNNNYTLTVNDSFLNNAPDKNNVSSWAVPAMKWATSAALMRGDNNCALRPRYSATRAEIATIFKRFIEIKADLDNDKPDVPTTCDHDWQVSETKPIEVYREYAKEWAHADELKTAHCTSCNLNNQQWYVDHEDEYTDLQSAKMAMTTDHYENKLYPCDHGGYANYGTMPLTFKTMSLKIYSADLPVEYTCSKCNKTKKAVTTKAVSEISDTNVWTPHVEDVIITPAYDEDLVTKVECEDYNFNIIPAGTHFGPIHHDAYVNQEIEYFQNNKTGEKIQVTMTGCRHSQWTGHRDAENGNIDYYYCTDCGARWHTVFYDDWDILKNSIYGDR